MLKVVREASVPLPKAFNEICNAKAPRARYLHQQDTLNQGALEQHALEQHALEQHPLE